MNSLNDLSNINLDDDSNLSSSDASESSNSCQDSGPLADYQVAHARTVTCEKCDTKIKLQIPLKFRVAEVDICCGTTIWESDVLIGNNSSSVAMRLRFLVENNSNPEIYHVLFCIVQYDVQLPQCFNLEIELYNATSHNLLSWRNYSIPKRPDALQCQVSRIGSNMWLQTCLQENMSELDVRLDLTPAKIGSCSACSELFSVIYKKIYYKEDAQYLGAIMRNLINHPNCDFELAMRDKESSKRDKESKSSGLTALLRIGKNSEDEVWSLQILILHVCAKCDRLDKMHGLICPLSVTLETAEESFKKRRVEYEIISANYYNESQKVMPWISLCTLTELKKMILKEFCLIIKGTFQNPFSGEHESNTIQNVVITKTETLVDKLSPNCRSLLDCYPKYFEEKECELKRNIDLKVFHGLNKIVKYYNNQNKCTATLFQRTEFGKDPDWGVLSQLLQEPTIRSRTSTLVIDFLLIIKNRAKIVCYPIKVMYSENDNDENILSEYGSIMRAVCKNIPVDVISFYIKDPTEKDFERGANEDSIFNYVSNLLFRSNEISLAKYENYERCVRTILILKALQSWNVTKTNFDTAASPQSCRQIVPICGRLFWFNTVLVNNLEQIEHFLQTNPLRQDTESSSASNGSNDSSRKTFVSAIWNCLQELCNRLDCMEILNTLPSLTKKFTTAVREKIMETRPDYLQNQAMLEWLLKQDRATYDNFKICLVNVGQEDLANILESAEHL